MSIQKTARASLWNAALYGTQQDDTTDELDFAAILKSNIQQAAKDLQETGMTAADQAVYARGGESALEAKYELQEESEDSSSSSVSGGSSSGISEEETIRKFMPDGSILLITTKDGKVVECKRKRPVMVEKPDFSKPRELENGQLKTPTKLTAKVNIFDMLMS